MRFLFKRNLYNFRRIQALNTILKTSTAPVSNMSNRHKIGICQLTCTNDKVHNFNICKQLVEEAHKQGAKMVFLPEACDYIETNTQATLEKAETINGEFISKFRKLAADLGIWISIGSFHRAEDSANGKPEKIFNSNVILDDQGQIKGVNDKIHLFEINLKPDSSTSGGSTKLKESDYTFHGQQFYLPLFTPIGSIGSAICYDLRFPQLSTILRKLGAQIITYPSVFTVPTGEAHWECLLRARAIENQCYVIASAQVGQHNEKRASYGHAMVVDPWGKVLVDCGKESPCVKVVEIDIDYLEEVRHSIPILNSFRNDLYLQMPLLKHKFTRDFYPFGESIQIPQAHVFLETSHCIAFVNIKPIVPGHVVIIPKQIRLRVEDMTDEEAVELFYVSREVASKMEKFFNATSINFGIQDGPESGQSVKHVHLHVLPRRKGDFRKDEIYEKLRSHDKDPSRSGRSSEQMAEEASELRKLFNY